jgi:hypothetical protein
MEILALILLLQLKHCYADFVIQTYVQTVKKGIYRDPIGISHSVDHVWTSIAVLLIFSFFVPTNPFVLIGVCLVEGIIHYHIDWIKVKYGSKDQTKPIFWTQFGLDQLAHQLTYLWMVWIILL